MYWDRWDIVIAHYVFCAHHHGGQNSELYRKLSRISRYFDPGRMSLDLLGEEYENARVIYNDLCIKHGFEPLQDGEAA